MSTLTIYEVPQTTWFSVESITYPGYCVVGTCGACGGRVLQPETWAGTNSDDNEPPKTCADCGKVAKVIVPRHGPIINMQ